MTASVLTVAEIADRLRVSKMTVYRLIHDGDLRHVRVRGLYRVSENALWDYMSGASVGYDPEKDGAS